MKRLFLAWMVLLALVGGSCYDDTTLKEGLDDLNSKYGSLEERVAALESLVETLNTDIASLQTVVTSWQNKVFVERVEEVADGYEIYFTDGKVAKIRDGRDGADGEDGTDGEDGRDGVDAPVVGVKKDTDGVYYWTLTVDGKTDWLLAEGKKLPVVGRDGTDGEDGKTPEVTIGKDGYWYINGKKTEVKAVGEDGETPTVSISYDGYWVINGERTSVKAAGEDGKDGVDGVTPLLKVDVEGYWIVSYDGGKSYTRLLDTTGKPVSAIGEKGDKGEDGKDGQDGQDGQDGASGVDGHTPDIGIKKDSDGCFYWTKDGEWILDEEGQKVKAEGVDGEDGVDAIAPKLKIENGYWMMSTDGGLSWTNIGQATGNDGKDGKDGDSFFKGVSENEECVTLELISGEIIKLPKYKRLTISFNETGEIVVMPGSSRTLHYTIEGGSENVMVKALGQNGWSARVKAISAVEGEITITAPDPMTDEEIVVLVYDGQQTTIMNYICCVQGVVNVANNFYEVPASEGVQEVPVSTNISYSVHIPEDAGWITVAQVNSRAMREETILFNIARNPGAERSATVEIRDVAGKAVQTIVFKQVTYALNVAVETPGTLREQLTEDDLKYVRELKITGVLNKTDFETITKEITELTRLDLSGVNLMELPRMAFMGAKNVKNLILPGNLTVINEQDFRLNSTLESVTIPAGVTMIKENAFEGCSSLVRVEIPANVTEIRSGAFKECTELVEVNIPSDSKLTLIGGLEMDGAFQGCTSLKSLIIPDGVETIGMYAFYGCRALKDVVFPVGLASIGSYAYYGCGVVNIDLPAEVEVVEECTFQGCVSLITLNVPSSSKLKKINYRAFWGCESLSLIKIGVTEPPRLFYDMSNFPATFDKRTCEECTVKVPAEFLNNYKMSSWSIFSKITAE